MTQSDQDVKHPPCERRGEKLGIKPLPDPKTVVLRYRHGCEVELEFVGWDVVYAWIASDGLGALRDGSRVILMDMHWSAQLWGRG